MESYRTLSEYCAAIGFAARNISNEYEIYTKTLEEGEYIYIRKYISFDDYRYSQRKFAYPPLYIERVETIGM